MVLCNGALSLRVPGMVDKPAEVVRTSQRVISCDPGVRTFLTTYSPSDKTCMSIGAGVGPLMELQDKKKEILAIVQAKRKERAAEVKARAEEDNRAAAEVQKAVAEDRATQVRLPQQGGQVSLRQRGHHRPPGVRHQGDDQQ